MGVLADLGAKINMRKRTVGFDPNVVEDIGMEESDEGDWIGVKVRDAWKESEEVMFDEFFLRDPKFLAAVIDDSVLVGVAVDGEGASRSGEEVGEEVGYKRLLE